MGRTIIKLVRDEVDYFLEWSTIVDAPVTWGMLEEDFRTYYQEEYGRQGLEKYPEYMAQVKEKGLIYNGGFYKSVEELISGNRAGENGTELSYYQLVEKYCKK